ncbi:M23 family metallopeptidase [Ammoniphilus resinae]|uniref:Stage II sporulation protein Q n=1 Tax=Ammoniphilus resinae TaxID=861532 RepID=A0ABS4GX09_9BACL|nr:M23 family metallopeptidase [Ammoniphilus resinae]MBP1934805.1 stage II sporulation protein Q [Ammoniphilus resinae]
MKEEQKNPIQGPKSKGIFSKKWTFPVMYMGAAALILAVIMWYQDSSQFSTGQEDAVPQVSMDQQQEQTEPADLASTQPEAVPVNQTPQGLAWPAQEDLNVKVVMKFYDEEAADDVKAASLVQYEDTYFPHTGIDLASEDGKTAFDVLAAADGKVTKVEKDPMVGYIVEIEHADGLTSIYQSVDDLQVAVNDEVGQGDILAKAGRNLFEKDLGIHLHFEVKENGQSVAPEKFLAQKEEKQAQ